MLYRKAGESYRRIALWSGWSISVAKWQGQTSIQYEALEPSADRQEHFVYFYWDGRKFVPNEPGEYGFEQ